MNKRPILLRETFIKRYGDEPGTRHGDLVLLLTKPIAAGEEVPLENSSRRATKASRTMYHCQCDCGNKTWVNISVWRNGYAKSCGKCFEPKPGKRYNKLTVIEEAPSKPRVIKGKVYSRRFWKCKCDCGREAVVAQDHLIGGHTTSCGKCKIVEHEHIPKLLYLELKEMAKNVLGRCTDVNYPSFYHYGGRGIECRLGNSTSEIAVKLYDNVPGYNKGLQLDRIDNNGHYEVGNLRWVTPQENAFNTVFNQKLDKTDLALRLLSYSTFINICNKNDWDPSDFNEVEIPLNDMTTRPPESPVYVFVYKEDEKSVDYYVKRILNFYTKYSGKTYTITIDSGLATKNTETGESIKLFKVITNRE